MRSAIASHDSLLRNWRRSKTDARPRRSSSELAAGDKGGSAAKKEWAINAPDPRMAYGTYSPMDAKERR